MATAFVLIRCEEGDEHEIRRSFDKTDVIIDFKPTIGHYDMIAKITSPSIRQLNETIKEFHGNDKVRATKVLLGSNQIAEAA